MCLLCGSPGIVVQFVAAAAAAVVVVAVAPMCLCCRRPTALKLRLIFDMGWGRDDDVANSALTGGRLRQQWAAAEDATTLARTQTAASRRRLWIWRKRNKNGNAGSIESHFHVKS